MTNASTQHMAGPGKEPGQGDDDRGSKRPKQPAGGEEE